MVIGPRQFVQVGGPPEAAHLRVGDGVAHALHARHDHGARAHGAGLLGHVDRCALEAPAAELRGRLGEGEHLRVRGRVLRALDPVVGGPDDLARRHDHRPDRHLVLAPPVHRLVVGHAHVERVVAHELRRESLLKGVFGGLGCGHGTPINRNSGPPANPRWRPAQGRSPGRRSQGVLGNPRLRSWRTSLGVPTRRRLVWPYAQRFPELLAPHIAAVRAPVSSSAVSAIGFAFMLLADCARTTTSATLSVVTP